MNTNTSYQIKLEQFEGPFDLLLFFIERDELDIYNIPITKITTDFLDYIHSQQKLNIELSSEFILFISSLMRVKAKMLLPRKEVDASGKEIDPRLELVDKLLEYKRYKEASLQMAEQEAERMLMIKRGNIAAEMTVVGESAAEGTEIQTVTLFKLMKTFEKVMQRLYDNNNKPVHTVVRYNYTMEESRTQIITNVKAEKKTTFKRLFQHCENRIQAIFLFLSILELVQLNYMSLAVDSGMNNFEIEWNEERKEEVVIPL